MHRELRIFLITVVAVIGLYIGLGSTLPQRWEVETSAELPAPPEKVLPMLRDFQSWLQWSTLSGTERGDVKMVVEGAPGTVGHQLAWRSPNNEAALVLTRVADDGVAYDLKMRVGNGGQERVQGQGSLLVVASGSGSHLRWRDDFVVDSIHERWFAWFGAQQDSQRKFQESSIARLRTSLEGK